MILSLFLEAKTRNLNDVIICITCILITGGNYIYYISEKISTKHVTVCSIKPVRDP